MAAVSPPGGEPGEQLPREGDLVVVDEVARAGIDGNGDEGAHPPEAGVALAYSRNRNVRVLVAAAKEDWRGSKDAPWRLVPRSVQADDRRLVKETGIVLDDETAWGRSDRMLDSQADIAGIGGQVEDRNGVERLTHR